MSFRTPLRYPGGKGRLTQYVAKVIDYNDLCDGHYVEPYAGGAGVAISLLMLEYVQKIHLNDINASVFSFWKAVLDHTDELCRLINDTPVTIDEWERQRDVQRRSSEVSTVALGFSTFFLNRTNRSGIISGGVIGGKKQDGKWKLDARFNKADLVKRIEKISLYRNRIHVSNLDAADFLQNYVSGVPHKSLVYLDPPYYVKGQGLYENHYTHDDHVRIAGIVLNELRQKWMVSYDDHPAIGALYASVEQEKFGLHYSANNRFSGSEVMIFKDGLRRPATVEPSRAAAV